MSRQKDIWFRIKFLIELGPKTLLFHTKPKLQLKLASLGV